MLVFLVEKPYLLCRSQGSAKQLLDRQGFPAGFDKQSAQTRHHGQACNVAAAGGQLSVDVGLDGVSDEVVNLVLIQYFVELPPVAQVAEWVEAVFLQAYGHKFAAKGGQPGAVVVFGGNDSDFDAAVQQGAQQAVPELIHAPAGVGQDGQPMATAGCGLGGYRPKELFDGHPQGLRDDWYQPHL